MPAVQDCDQTPENDDAVVRLALTPDQLVGAKGHAYGRQHLTAGMLTIMWGLRVYAVLMLIVVAYSVIRAVHTS